MEKLSEKRLKRIEEIFRNPPPNSKLAKAKEFGADLTLLAENLQLTPQERIDKAQTAMSFFEEICQPAESPKKKNLGDILISFVSRKVNFVIVGEAACFIHGWKHISPKLEILYSSEHENLKKIISAFSPFNPRLRGFSEKLPFTFDETTLQNKTNFKFTTEIGDIDLLKEIKGIGGFTKVEKMSAPIEIYGYRMKVLSLEGLIKAKRAAGRTKDLLVLPELEALRELLSETEN